MSKMVSIILTTCGRWPLLREAIDSVYSQAGFDNAELILVCDCHTRPFEEYIEFCRKEKIGSRLKLVRYDQDESDAGYVVKRIARMVNLGLDKAEGEYIAYLCDDDVWTDGALHRRLAAIKAGARWIVDRVQWRTPDGDLKAQADIGVYLYPKPFEEQHAELTAALSESDVNWICHDCSMHEATDLRWEDDDDPAKAPVDWRFWCALFRSGVKPTCIAHVGAEAFYPASWRKGMDMKKALRARARRVTNMGKKEKIVYAVNVGSGGPAKVEIITTPDGRTIEIPPMGRIPAKDVTTPKGELFPSFVIDGVLEVPKFEAPEPDFETIPLEQKPGMSESFEPTGSLLVDEPPPEKPAYTRVDLQNGEVKTKAGDGYEKKYTREELDAMFKTQLVALLEDEFQIKASMGMLKKHLIDKVLKAQA